MKNSENILRDLYEESFQVEKLYYSQRDGSYHRDQLCSKAENPVLTPLRMVDNASRLCFKCVGGGKVSFYRVADTLLSTIKNYRGVNSVSSLRLLASMLDGAEFLSEEWLMHARDGRQEAILGEISGLVRETLRSSESRRIWSEDETRQFISMRRKPKVLPIEMFTKERDFFSHSNTLVALMESFAVYQDKVFTIAEIPRDVGVTLRREADALYTHRVLDNFLNAPPFTSWEMVSLFMEEGMRADRALETADLLRKNNSR